MSSYKLLILQDFKKIYQQRANIGYKSIKLVITVVIKIL